MKIGNRLVELRQELNIARSTLSKKSGVALSFINDIERGGKEPTVHTIKRLCNAMDISLSDFFSEKTPELPFEIKQIINKVQKLSQRQLRILNDVLDEWIDPKDK